MCFQPQKAMEREIISSLGIPSEGVIRTGLLRENLHLSVSRDSERMTALLDMLQKDRRYVTSCMCDASCRCTTSSFQHTWNLQEASIDAS